MTVEEGPGRFFSQAHTLFFSRRSRDKPHLPENLFAGILELAPEIFTDCASHYFSDPIVTRPCSN